MLIVIHPAPSARYPPSTGLVPLFIVTVTHVVDSKSIVPKTEPYFIQVCQPSASHEKTYDMINIPQRVPSSRSSTLLR